MNRSRELRYNSHIMRNNTLVALAFAVVAGCGPDDGSADFEKAEAAYVARDLQTAVLCYGNSRRRFDFYRRIRSQGKALHFHPRCTCYARGSQPYESKVTI